jgi:hypothetical protein
MISFWVKKTDKKIRWTQRLHQKQRDYRAPKQKQSSKKSVERRMIRKTVKGKMSRALMHTDLEKSLNSDNAFIGHQSCLFP